MQLPCLFETAAPPGKAGVGWTRDLSEGGACLELAECLPPRTPLQLTFKAPEAPVQAEAEVVWARVAGVAVSGALHGVRFLKVAPAEMEALRALIHIKGQGRQAGVRLPLELPVTCRPKGQGGPPFEGVSGDISRGGMLLRLPEVLPPDTVLEITLHTPKGPLTAWGGRAWVDPPERRIPGELIRQGIQFLALDWSTTLSLGLCLAG
jgi:hypothetical protein